MLDSEVRELGVDPSGETSVMASPGQRLSGQWGSWESLQPGDTHNSPPRPEGNHFPGEHVGPWRRESCPCDRQTRSSWPSSADLLASHCLNNNQNYTLKQIFLLLQVFQTEKRDKMIQIENNKKNPGAHQQWEGAS